MGGDFLARTSVLAGLLLSAPPAAPNFIFILADDLGYGDTGPYGQAKIKTPSLDRMAREGMKFTDFYAGSPVCAPSRAILLTGLHAGHAAIRMNQEVPGGQTPLPAASLTVAGLLKARGYATACIGKWGLGAPGSVGHPNRQGFDLFYGYLDQVHAHDHFPDSLWRNGKAEKLDGKTWSGDRFTEEALAYIRGRKAAPFFLFLAYSAPHAQLQVPDLAPYADEPWTENRKKFAAMVTRMDRDIGRLMDSLGSWGLDSTTAVFFSSDNGPHAEGGADTGFFNGNGPLRGMKRDLYDGGMREPFLVRWPGHVAAGKASAHIGYFPDLFPTLCELAGTSSPEGLDGVSFAPLLLGRPADQKAHASLYWEFRGDGRDLTAGRMGPWKAVRKGTAALELYDLASDIDESDNLAGRYPEKVAQFQALFQSAHSDTTPLIRMPPATGIRSAPDPRIPARPAGEAYRPDGRRLPGARKAPVGTVPGRLRD